MIIEVETDRPVGTCPFNFLYECILALKRRECESKKIPADCPLRDGGAVIVRFNKEK